MNFRYDPLGRRIGKRVRYQRMDLVSFEAEKFQPADTQFLWEGPRLLAEFSGSRTQVYAYSDQHSYAPLARIDGAESGSKVYYFHNQVNGQPEAMTDSEGKECWRGEPDSWGKIKGETHPREITTGGPQNLRMQGQYLDRETGLHYNLYRYYDPDNGRFIQQDPIGLLGGLNLYQYAPNALGWVDPWGLSCGRIFERNPKHGRSQRGNANPEPSNPQESLNSSIPLPGNTSRRISVDKKSNEIVIFDEHTPDKYHGHIRAWDELNQTMQAVLRKAGLANKKGKL